MSETVKAPRCGDCKSEGSKDRFGEICAATRVSPIYKNGTTQVSKWGFFCEQHVLEHVGRARAAHEKGEAPPCFKLSLALDGQEKRGDFHVDCYGGTNPSTNLTWQEQNRCYTTSDIEKAKKLKRERLLTKTELALWDRRKELAFSSGVCSGGVEAQITAASPPGGWVYYRVEDEVYNKSQETLDDFQQKVYDMLDGYNAHFNIQVDEDNDTALITLDLLAAPHFTPQMFKETCEGYLAKYQELRDALESEEEDEEHDDEEESCDCMECCPDDYCGNCEERLDNCECEE